MTEHISDLELVLAAALFALGCLVVVVWGFWWLVGLAWMAYRPRRRS